MATTIDHLQVRIDADMKQLREQLNRVEKLGKKSGKALEKSFDKADRSSKKLTKSVGLLKGAILAVASGVVIKNLVAINGEFQDLQISLDTVFGSMRAGQDAMAFIQDFAQSTPFDIQTLSRAMITLKATGINPTKELLTTLGDAASVTTDKLGAFNALVRVTSRSLHNIGLEDLNQIADRGLPVWDILQQKLGITRLEISKMGQTAEGAKKIMDALKEGLNERFGGGMERAADTLNTAMSNMKIAAVALVKEMGDGGLTDSMTDLANNTKDLLTQLKPLANVLGGALSIAVDTISISIKALAVSLEAVGDAIDSLDRSEQNQIKLTHNNLGLAKLDDPVKRREVQNLLGGYSGHSRALIQGNLQSTIDAKAVQDEREAFRQRLRAAKEETAQRSIFRTAPELVDNSGANRAAAKEETAQRNMFRAGNESFDKYVEQARKSTIANEKLKESFNELGDAFSSSLAKNLREGKSLLAGFADDFDNWIDGMLAKVLKEQIFGAIFGLGGGGSGGALSAFGGAGPTIAKSGGGDMYAGQRYRVGESGPEDIIMGTNAKIIPHNKLNNNNGTSGPVSINMNIQTEDPTVDAKLAAMIPAIEQRMYGALQDAIGRGGALASRFGV